MIFRALYDFVLFVLLLVSLPFLLLQRVRYGKYKKSLLQKLGLQIPALKKGKGDRVIWIHTISLGETKAAVSYFESLKKLHPNAKFVISTITETGMSEAKKSMSSADVHMYLPLDFSWLIKRLVKKIGPDLVVLTESDLWYNFLYFAKKAKARTILINGKLSERSFKRYRKVPFFFSKIISSIDFICTQNGLYRERFITLGANPLNVEITGNIKLDAAPRVLSDDDKRTLCSKLSLKETDRIITLGSTHYPEEDMILTVVEPLMKKDPNLKLLLCPRHTERCHEVISLLQKKKLDFSVFSEMNSQLALASRIVLIDKTGILTDLYQISHLALVCGSFTDTVGGHNIFEPILYGVPVIFGPHMYSQRDLRDLIKASKAGKEVRLEDLSSTIEGFFTKVEERKSLEEQGIKLKEEVKGALKKTVSATERLYPADFIQYKK